LQGRKEAARAGAAIAILPGFAVREELRTKSLIKLNAKGLQLSDTRLMLIESRQRSPKANVETVKGYIIEALSTMHSR
jgi:DNA-binding transcriptional LysR family regulator